MIDRKRLKKVFVDLLQINSPSKHERGVADYAGAALESLGFEVEEDDAAEAIGGDSGNVFGFRKGGVSGAAPIFLCAHMDTVQPTEGINIQFDGSEFRTDGSTILGADDKAGITAILEGVRSIVEDGTPHGDVQVILLAAEEIGLLGSKAMDIAKIRAEMGYVLDTEKPVAGITISAPSHETVLAEIQGRAAHAGIAPEKGVNAIVAASRAIAKMNLGRIDPETTANIGVIEGGKARNIVPDRVTVKGEARSRDERKLTAQLEHMKSLFEQEASAIGASAKVERQREYTAFRWTENDRVVELAVDACRSIGIKPVFQEGGGGSDANTFNSAGVASVVVGVGYEDAHTAREHISLDDLARSAEFVEALVKTAAGG